MSEDYKRRQAELIAERVKEADFIITTALIPGPPGAEARHRRDGPEHEAGQRHHRHGGRDGRQRRGHRAGQGGRQARRPDHRPHEPAGDHAGAARPRCTPRTSRPWSSTSLHDGTLNLDFDDEITRGATITHGGKVVHEATAKALGIEVAPATRPMRPPPKRPPIPHPKPRRTPRPMELDPFALVSAALHPRPRRLRRLRGRLQGADHAPHAADERRQRRARRDRRRRDARGRHGRGADRDGPRRWSRVVLGTINVVGGFVVTDRMLEMFRKRPGDRELDGTLQILTYLVWLVAQRHLHPGPEVPGPPATARTGNLLGAAGMALVVAVDLLHRPRGCSPTGGSWSSAALIGAVVGVARRAARADDRDAADGRHLQRRGRWRRRAGRGRRVPARHRAINPGELLPLAIRDRDAARRGHRLRRLTGSVVAFGKLQGLIAVATGEVPRLADRDRRPVPGARRRSASTSPPSSRACRSSSSSSGSRWSSASSW